MLKLLEVKPKEKLKQFNCRMPVVMIQNIAALAADVNLTQCDLLREALARGMAQIRKEISEP